MDVEGRVTEEDIAALTGKLAEAAGAARAIRVKLDAIDGPLALLAALRIEALQGQIDTLIADSGHAADLLLSAGAS